MKQMVQSFPVSLSMVARSPRAPSEDSRYITVVKSDKG